MLDYSNNFVKQPSDFFDRPRQSRNGSIFGGDAHRKQNARPPNHEWQGKQAQRSDWNVFPFDLPFQGYALQQTDYQRSDEPKRMKSDIPD